MTIARLMAVVAASAVLFALPVVLTILFAAIAAGYLLAWYSAIAIARLACLLSRRSGGVEYLPALAFAAFVLGIIPWFALLFALILMSPTWVPSTLLISAASGTVGFVLSLATIHIGRQRSALGWRDLAMVAGFLSCPLYTAVSACGGAAIVKLLGVA